MTDYEAFVLFVRGFACGGAVAACIAYWSIWQIARKA